MEQTPENPCPKFPTIHASPRPIKAMGPLEFLIFAFGQHRHDLATQLKTMSKYPTYLQEIEDRKAQGLHPKPIDDASLLNDIIDQIKDPNHPDREDSWRFFV